jgi:hypothetical protein
MRRARTTGAVRSIPPALVDALINDWEEHGAAAFERLRKWKPDRYVQLVSTLAPAMLASRESDVAAMSDEEIVAEITAIHDKLAKAGALPPSLRLAGAGDD